MTNNVNCTLVMPFSAFLDLLYTESEEEYKFENEEKVQEAWKNQAEIDWKYAEESPNQKFPFICCYIDPFLSGQERLISLIDHGLSSKNLLPLKNDLGRSCFLIYATASWCRQEENILDLMLHPLSYSMKMLADSIDLVEQLLNNKEEASSEAEVDDETNNTVVLSKISLDVLLCPGVVVNDEDFKGKEGNVTDVITDTLQNEINETLKNLEVELNNETISDEIHDNTAMRTRPPEKNSTNVRMLQENATSSDSTIREKVLNLIGQSLSQKLYWHQENSDSATNARAKFWQDVLSLENDNMTQANFSAICFSSYSYIDFSFQSTSSTLDTLFNTNLTVMTVDFTQLQNAILESKLKKSVMVRIANKCILRMLLALSLMEETCSVQTRPDFIQTNHNAQWLLQTGVKDSTPWYDVGIDGTGEVVAISDTGIDLNHCYFRNSEETRFQFGGPLTLDLNQRKVVQYDPFVNEFDYEYGHGTHVAGSVCGKPPDRKGLSQGIAYNAKVAFIDIGYQDGSLTIPTTNRLLHTGFPYAKIHSASWGSTFPGYGIQAFLMDSYAYENDELLLMFAAGNSGEDGAAETVGEPATSKNCIAVGAANSYGSDSDNSMLGPSYIAYFSSRGPTLDGRTKPDLIAPGRWVSSAAALLSEEGECDPIDGVTPGPGDKNGGLISFQGTSMATPIASGAAALIRQYLREGYYPSGIKNETFAQNNPSSSLIKAILLNGGQEMDGVDNGKKGISSVHPYDNTQNFGRLSLADSLYIQGKTNVQANIWDREIIKDDQTLVYKAHIDTSYGCSETRFSATLVWTDVPGLPGCAECLINDLDLFVTKNNDDSQVFFPNGKETEDTKNNAERVRVENVVNGDVMTMYVQATSVISEQNFALVATGCFGGIPASENGTNVYHYDDSSINNQQLIVILVISIPIGVCILSSIIVGICKAIG